MLDQIDTCIDNSLPHDVTSQNPDFAVHACIERDMNLLLALLGQYLIENECERYPVVRLYI
jgi:hypothetical protein